MNAARRHEWYAGASDIGLVRADNEDAYLMEPPLFAVADGLGGHQAGEVASTVAMETLLAHAPKRADAKGLARAVRAANAAVIDAAEQGRGREGMGTTLTAAMVEGTRIAVAHVGDSRAYLLSRGALTQLTQDHSLVADMVRSGTLSPEAARRHPNRSVITRALGSDPNMVADAFEVQAAAGDRLLLCTDGLTGMVEDTAIADILRTAPSPSAAVTRLIAAANEAGGHDNITVVVVDIPADAQREHEPAGGSPGAAVGLRRVRAARLAWALALVAVVVASVLGARAYARSQAYLVDEGGRVAVYRGVPGEFAGVRLRWLEQVTDVPVAALDPVTAARLKRGVRVEDLASAFELVSVYRARASVGTSQPAEPAPSD
ncbi:Stp1/IreP family PP2C-type Ser/Thr phosphatase [Coriobacteriia bacterium Es71-Z0120]|uniref:Stp1/IreP family PP2C-type Ser/Thr phosphatase n=1 Tax=Parvivirga hydrogeniphila TaxID=2939460 RepID=UPI002260BD57|nr:Stp1/IreP family PP2C-type Ser/Thr phosphatase [Parvivirga hydrogeniphila]MCL4078257.1 Stp1/IreP family PP2C-type Ser/Thr phosphatase [Parvivirga hydrogeniphila]